MVNGSELHSCVFNDEWMQSMASLVSQSIIPMVEAALRLELVLSAEDSQLLRSSGVTTEASGHDGSDGNTVTC